MTNHLLKDLEHDYRRWKPVYLHKNRDPTANKPREREKRKLAKQKRTTQKQQGPIHVTEQKHRREGNRPEHKHRV